MPNPVDASGEALLKSALEGSRNGLGQLLQHLRPDLLLLAEQRLGPRLRVKGSAEDLVQETVADVLTHFSNFRGRTLHKFYSWLRSIFHHNLIDFLRQFAPRTKRDLSLERSLQSAHRPTLMSGPEWDPACQVERAEQLQRLEQTLLRLSARDQRVLRMHHQQELPIADVAQQLGCSEGAARERCLRAMQRLRKAMGVAPEANQATRPRRVHGPVDGVPQSLIASHGVARA